MPIAPIFLAFPLAAGAPAAAPGAAILPFTPVVEAGRCPNARPRHANDPRGATARRLDQLPQGRLELAVQREIEGCAIPAVVREGIGAPPRP